MRETLLPVVGNRLIYTAIDKKGNAFVWVKDAVFKLHLFVVKMTAEQLEQIRLRHSTLKKIQDILPNHSPAERELFVSGLSGTEWDLIFSEVKEFGCYKNLMTRKELEDAIDNS